MKHILLMLISTLIASVSMAHKADSIGSKVKNGKLYIVHEVAKGDGLYGISKKYKVSLKQIVEANPGADEVIKIGQTILIPSTERPELKNRVVTDFFDGSTPKDNRQNESSDKVQVSTFAKYHQVTKGETLYALSKKYKTSVEMIKNLNGLKTNELSEGQRLLVQDGSAKTETVDKSNEVETEYVKMKREMAAQKYDDIGYKTPVKTEETKSTAGYSIRVEKLVEYDMEKIEEQGTMAVGSPKLPKDKNFALHFNAPNGTVIMVTNPENKNTVFVKVIGNFNKKENSSEIIILSESSAKQVQLTPKSKVMLSYAR